MLDVEAYNIRLKSALLDKGIGGYIEASFRVRRPLDAPHPDLAENNRVIIKDGSTIVFDGRMLEPKRSWARGKLAIWEITCIGAGKQAGERLHDRVWVETSTANEHWVKAGSFLGGSFTTLYQENGWSFDNNNRLRVGAKSWEFLQNTGCTGGWFYELPRPQYTSDKITRIEFNWKVATTSGSWQAVCRAYDVNRNFLTNVWSTCIPTGGSASGSEQLNLTGSTVRGILFGLSYQGSQDAYPGDDDSILYAQFSNIFIRTHGDGSGSELYQDTFIQGLLRPTADTSEKLGLISSDTSLITLGSPKNIGSETLRWLEGKRVVDVINDVIALGDNAASPNKIYCNVWSPTFKGLIPDDNLPKMELCTYDLTAWDAVLTWSSVRSIEVTTSDEIITRALVRYKDEYGRTQWTPIYSSGCMNTYSRRDAEIQVDTTSASRALAIRDMTVRISDHLNLRLIITIDSPIQTATGGIVNLSEIRAGLRLKLAGLGDEPVFLITETEYDDDTKITRIVPGAITGQLELQLSKLLAGLGLTL